MVGKVYSIDEIKQIITPLAGQYGVKSVSLFGSYSTGTAKANSDIDLKIEKGQLRSLFQISSFRLALEDALSLPVDLLTCESSDKEFLKAISKNEVLLYQAT